MSQNDTKVRWGVLGAARINRRLIPGLKQSNNAELLAIASRDRDKAHQAAAQWGAELAYDSYEALLNDRRIEAVYIPLPNTLHVEWAIKAAQAGKHVLCEKPLALTPEDVLKVKEAAENNKVQVMEAFMYRFHPQQERVRELLAEGAIGEARVVRASFAFPMVTGNYNIRLDNALGGGAIWDVGCYGVNVARWMLGIDPVSVYAEATLEQGVDVSAVAILDFGAQKRAVMDFGLNYGRRSFYEIIGTAGTLSVENMWQEPDIEGYVYLRNEKGLTTEPFAPVNHFKLEVEAFSQAILDGQPAPYPLSDSVENARACNALQQSIREGHRIQL
jgi:predicted dehydrogenase